MSARKRCASCGAFAKKRALKCPACGAVWATAGLLEEAAGAVIDGVSSLRKGMPRKPIRTHIHGIDLPNADGTSRPAEIVERCCKIGTTLDARPEPLNPYDSHAIGLWVHDGGESRRVGYVVPALAVKLGRVLEAGGSLRVVVLEVTGGMIRSKKVHIVIDPEIVETPVDVEPRTGIIATVGRSKVVEMAAKAGGPVPTLVHRVLFGRKP